jgi:hypothetical protein
MELVQDGCPTSMYAQNVHNLIYETDVPRTTRDSNANPGSSSENHRSNERMKEEIRELLARH